MQHSLTDRRALSPRESEVLSHVVMGRSSKEIGRLLGTSPRTVECQKVSAMLKMGARNTADLVRLAMTADRPNPVTETTSQEWPEGQLLWQPKF